MKLSLETAPKVLQRKAGSQHMTIQTQPHVCGSCYLTELSIIAMEFK